MKGDLSDYALAQNLTMVNYLQDKIKNKDRKKERRLISCWSMWREEDLSCQIGRFRAECHTIISGLVSTLGTKL
jgi:hypothetical protein